MLCVPTYSTHTALSAAGNRRVNGHCCTTPRGTVRLAPGAVNSGHVIRLRRLQDHGGRARTPPLVQAHASFAYRKCMASVDRELAVVGGARTLRRTRDVYSYTPIAQRHPSRVRADDSSCADGMTCHAGAAARACAAASAFNVLFVASVRIQTSKGLRFTSRRTAWRGTLNHQLAYEEQCGACCTPTMPQVLSRSQRRACEDDDSHFGRFRSSRSHVVRVEDGGHAAVDTAPGTPDVTVRHRSSTQNIDRQCIFLKPGRPCQRERRQHA